MWPFSPKRSKPTVVRLVNFTRPRPDHWASFEGGDNFDAQFLVRGGVSKGDEIFVLMESGRVGCYQLFSVIRDFTGKADWRVRGCAVGYFKDGKPVQDEVEAPSLPVPRLASDKAWGVRSYASELAPLPVGFTEPTSEFWKIRARNEARSARASQLRATGDLSIG